MSDPITDPLALVQETRQHIIDGKWCQLQSFAYRRGESHHCVTGWWFMLGSAPAVDQVKETAAALLGMDDEKWDQVRSTSLRYRGMYLAQDVNDGRKDSGGAPLPRPILKQQAWLNTISFLDDLAYLLGEGDDE